MFDYDEEYKKATESAMVNTCNDINEFNWNALFSNILLLSAFIGIGYFSFTYVKQETNFFQKTSVMGVSHTVSDNEYEQQVNTIYDKEVNGNKTNINDALSDIVNTSTSREESQYTQAISKEIDTKHQQESRTIVIKEGDTLASISKKYYGNSMAFNKIIESNRELSNDSHMIYIGQKLNLPY